ncbi:MAG: hypothetical protein Q7R75_02485 [bacterium]|nr:hypothetical protein [bacterium]
MKQKKLILGLIILLLALAGWFLIFSPKNLASIVYESKSALGFKNTDENTDSDNDGLKDWEETLWKTDPRKADTDGDGTPDGQEIKENRNPLVKGPNDSLLETVLPLAGSENQNQEQQTLTDILGKEIISTALTAKTQSGQPLSESQKSKIMSSFVFSLDTLSKNDSAVYESKDVHLVPAGNPEKTKAYGNDIAAIIKKYFDPLDESELDVLQNALKNQDEAKLKKLENLSAAYENSSKEISNIDVPYEFLENHLAVINSFHQISVELKNMQKVFSDPALGLVAIKQYKESSQKAYEALKGINNYFTKNGIVFDKKESGSLLAVYI